MALVPMDAAHITAAVQSDMTYMRGFIQWANQRYKAYNQVCTAAAMTAATIAAGDQNIILAFIGDLNRICQLTSGTLPAAATDVVFNINAALTLQQ